MEPDHDVPDSYTKTRKSVQRYVYAECNLRIASKNAYVLSSLSRSREKITLILTDWLNKPAFMDVQYKPLSLKSMTDTITRCIDEKSCRLHAVVIS